MEEHRLARIIRLKERLREARRGELAQAEERHAAAQAQSQETLQQLIRFRENYVQRRDVSAQELALQSSLTATARRTHDAMLSQLHELGIERDRRAEISADAAREVRCLELLEAKSTATRTRALRQREQILNDDVGRRRRRR